MLQETINPTVVLKGKHVQLEPMEMHHAEGLAAAAASALDPALYRWTHVPRTHDEAVKYIASALVLREAGTALPLVTIRVDDGAVIGSTRFFDMQTWDWPQGHRRH